MICKLEPRKLEKTKEACFILTMWYVNDFVRSAITFLSNSFYINYVICKLKNNQNINTEIVMFYINYVICKYYICKSNMFGISCFILTMWYVN